MGLTIAQIRPGDDQTRLAEFRYRVYVEEQGNLPPNADHERRILRDSLDHVSTSHVIVNGDQIVGSLRVTFLDDVSDPEPFISTYAMGPAIKRFGTQAIGMTSRFIIDPSVKRGTATLDLIDSGYRQGIERGARFNYGDCSPHLLPFYEHMGYRRYAGSFNDPVYGLKLPILMLLRDREQFRAAGSPMLRLALGQPDDTDVRSWFATNYPEFVRLESAQFLPSGSFLRLVEQRSPVDLLSSSGLLHGLAREEVDLLLAKATMFKADPGDCIYRRQDRTDALFFIISGTVEARSDVASGPSLVLLHAGSSFGQFRGRPLLPDKDLIATTACELIAIPGDYLSRILNKNTDLSEKLKRNVALIAI